MNAQSFKVLFATKINHLQSRPNLAGPMAALISRSALQVEITTLMGGEVERGTGEGMFIVTCPSNFCWDSFQFIGLLNGLLRIFENLRIRQIIPFYLKNVKKLIYLFSR